MEQRKQATVGAMEIKKYHPVWCFRCAANDVDPQNVHRNKHCSEMCCFITLLYNNPFRYSLRHGASHFPCLVILNKGSLDFRNFFEKMQLFFYLHKFY